MYPVGTLPRRRACTGASWAEGVMVASVSSMCSRRASYERKRRRAGASREGTRGPKASSSGELSSLAFAASPAK
eukprot:5450620-Pleurochrysis_carterae.AAC.1